MGFYTQHSRSFGKPYFNTYSRGKCAIGIVVCHPNTYSRGKCAIGITVNHFDTTRGREQEACFSRAIYQYVPRNPSQGFPQRGTPPRTCASCINQYVETHPKEQMEDTAIAPQKQPTIQQYTANTHLLALWSLKIICSRRGGAYHFDRGCCGAGLSSRNGVRGKRIRGRVR